MRTHFFGFAAATLLLAGTALADQFTDSIVSNLRGQGYGNIEIRQTARQVKVEAVRGSEKLEVTYDRSTGSILKQETETVRAGDRSSGSVIASSSGRSRSDDGHHRSGDDDSHHRGGDDDGHHRSGDDDDHRGGGDRGSDDRDDDLDDDRDDDRSDD